MQATMQWYSLSASHPRLDTEEMKAWIGSGEVELAEEETANLLKEADKDGVSRMVAMTLSSP